MENYVGMYIFVNSRIRGFRIFGYNNIRLFDFGKLRLFMWLVFFSEIFKMRRLVLEVVFKYMCVYFFKEERRRTERRRRSVFSCCIW